MKARRLMAEPQYPVSEIPGLGDRAKLRAPGTFPRIAVVVGHTVLELDVTSGPAGAERWLLPLAVRP